jgi:hypothetical protein
MRAHPLLALAAASIAIAACSKADSPQGGQPPPTPATHVDTIDPEIGSMRDAIDESRMATDIQSLVAFGTRNACSSLDGGTTGIAAARDWIANEMKSIPNLQVQLHDFPITDCAAPRTLQNVIGVLPGKDTTRAVLVGGHYDSRTIDRNDGTSLAPGANDSGSQTALVLEAAHALSTHTFETTVVFVAFAAEEQGLRGSTALAADFGTLFPGTTLEAVLNCDIVGGDQTANDANALQQFRVYSPGTPRETGNAPDGTSDDTSPARDLMRYVGEWGADYVPAMGIVPKLREDRVGRGGDHEPFLAAGITAVRFIETNETFAHQHSPDDLFANVTPAYAARMARIVSSVLASLARSPRAPSAVQAMVDTNGAHVSFTPSTSTVDHHVVVLRDAATDLYQTFVDTLPGASSATIDPSKLPSGAFYVNVGAVDAAGHASLFAYPEVRCEAGTCAAPTDALDVTTAISK